MSVPRRLAVVSPLAFKARAVLFTALCAAACMAVVAMAAPRAAHAQVTPTPDTWGLGMSTDLAAFTPFLTTFRVEDEKAQYGLAIFSAADISVKYMALDWLALRLGLGFFVGQAKNYGLRTGLEAQFIVHRSERVNLYIPAGIRYAVQRNDHFLSLHSGFGIEFFPAGLDRLGFFTQLTLESWVLPQFLLYTAGGQFAMGLHYYF